MPLRFTLARRRAVSTGAGREFRPRPRRSGLPSPGARPASAVPPARSKDGAGSVCSIRSSEALTRSRCICMAALESSSVSGRPSCHISDTPSPVSSSGLSRRSIAERRSPAGRLRMPPTRKVRVARGSSAGIGRFAGARSVRGARKSPWLLPGVPAIPAVASAERRHAPRILFLLGFAAFA